MSENHLKDVLKKVLSDLEEKGKEEHDLLMAWERAVGKRAARHTKPASLKSRKLTVNVSDSTWLYKLTLERKDIAERFNAIVGKKGKIRELRFRIGDI
jgi:predicted nucleic acid-binding Zn ribbon protein